MDTIKDMLSDKVRNFFNRKENLGLAKNRLNSLICRASDLKQEVTIAEGTGNRKRKREPENWFQEVEQMVEKFSDLECRIQKQPWWKNLSSGDGVAKLDANVQRLMEQSKDFEGRLWFDDHENRGEPLLVTKTLFGQDSQEGWKTIWDWLVKDDLFNVGIYGMGGVGKTTLAKCLHNKLLEKTNFKVFWVTVSQNFSIQKLRDEIAKQVPLDLSGDENRRAAKLSRAITNHSLLILDDVWEDFSLEDVGIPVGPKCRLILTTRSLELCNTMDCRGKYEVKCLEADEAWSLFKKTLDHGTKLSVEADMLAKLVAKECAGLPLAIITVARSMRGATDIRQWRNALDQLRTLSIGYKKMEDRVFRILEWSFNHLNRYERLCFLYCCLYPEDWKIEREELINLYSSAELIPRWETKQSEFDHGHTILNKLIKACLLEEFKTSEGKECVKMHDLIRDMALRITSGKYISNITKDVPRFLVKSNIKKSNGLLVEKEEWKDNLDAVSLRGHLYDYFRPTLEFPALVSSNFRNLSTLIINHVNITEIPDSFLQHMSGLKVLNLEACRELRALPSCVSDLVNLTALLLKNCKCLESVPPLGKLKRLRILNLLCTGVGDVPKGLEELLNLERLYFGFVAFPEGTFSKLHRLQHLVAFDAALDINDIMALKELELCFGDLTLACAYDQFAKSWRWPSVFDIVIKNKMSDGRFRYHDVDYQNIKNGFRNKLKFERCHFQKGVDVVLLPENLRILDIVECSDFSDISFHRWIDGSKDLCELSLVSLKELKFVLDFSSLENDDDKEGVTSNLVGGLQNLRDLMLMDLRNLVELINWRLPRSILPAGTFSSLEDLYIEECDRLKKLFSVQLLQQSLPNLKNLRVFCCDEVEEIVGNYDEEEAMEFQVSSSGSMASTAHLLLLPKLQKLTLCFLPKLKSVCSPTITIGGDQPAEFNLCGCAKLKRLPSFSSARITYEIKGCNEWWNSLEWENPSDKDAVQPFFKEL